MPGLLYADDLVLCDELEEDKIVACFVKACRRGGMKVNEAKSKVMVFGGEKGLVCKVLVDGMQMEHVSEFKYLGCVSEYLGTDGAKCQGGKWEESYRYYQIPSKW